MHDLTISETITRKIEKGGLDRLWTYSDFKPFPQTAVAATLSRLAKQGVVNRIRNGVYYKPKITRFGTTTPDPARVVEAVLKHRGVTATSSGLPAYNALGLTTQVSPVPTFAIDRKVANVRTGLPGRIRLRLVSVVRGLIREERAVLDALRDLSSIPDTTPAESLYKIAELFRSGRLSFERVATAARWEPPRVRALIGMLGTMLGANAKMLERLRGTLNNTTTFKLGLSGIIPEARVWGIR